LARLLLRLLLHRRPQHAATALGRAAAAGIGLVHIRRIFLVARNLVVVAQLLALLDVLDRFDEHPALLGLGSAVAIAAVVDETRIVATPGGVDHGLAIGDEQEGMVVVRISILVTLVRFLVRQALANIFGN